MRQPASKVGHVDPGCRNSHPFMALSPALDQGWSLSDQENMYGRCDGMTLLRLDYKRLYGFHLDHSFSLLDLTF